MKTYTIAELKRIAREQKYKLACLQNSQGDKLLNNNNLKVKIEEQLKNIENRLNSDLYADGLYYVCMSLTINTAKNPDRYPTTKGEYKAEVVKKEAPIITTVSEDILSWDAALKFQTKISELQTEVSILKFEKELLKKEIAEMEKETPLNDNNGENSIKSFLQETLPSVIPIVENYFKLETRKLDQKDKELSIQEKKKPIRSAEPITVGSKQHLAMIHHYATNNQEDKLNTELDKLENVNEELYLQVCKELNIDLTGGEDE